MRGYTRLDQVTAADCAQALAEHMNYFATAAPLRVMDQIRSLADLEFGFPCSQLQHALMTATLAREAGADDETIVVALCHDLGKVLSVANHAAISAEMLKYYVSDQHYQAVLHHQEFQSHYYGQFIGQPTNLRDAYREEPWYALAESLVDEWDMPAFNPDFTADPLESFEPAVIKIFSAPRMI